MPRVAPFATLFPMPMYDVQGPDARTGQDRSISFEADDDAQAAAVAKVRGVMVAKLERRAAGPTVEYATRATPLESHGTFDANVSAIAAVAGVNIADTVASRTRPAVDVETSPRSILRSCVVIVKFVMIAIGIAGIARAFSDQEAAEQRAAKPSYRMIRYHAQLTTMVSWCGALTD